MRFRRRAIAQEEQLEIEKLHEQELAANKGSEFDVLYDQTQKNIAADQETNEKNDSTDEPPAGGDDEALGEEEATPSEEAPALEEIRSLTYASEDFATFTHDFKETSMLLGTLGITFSLAIISNLFKGVVYVFCKIARLVYVSTWALKKYLERREGSFEGIKASVADLRKTLDAVKESGDASDLSEQKYTQTKIINTLKIGNSVAFSENVEVLRRFVGDTVQRLSAQIEHETSAVQHIVSASARDATTLPAKLMNIDAHGVGLTAGVVEGYAPASEYVQAYHSAHVLPSDVVLIAAFPRDDLEDFDAITKAYNDSSMVLGFNMASFTEVETVDYMTIDDLSGFLDKLDQLCDVCIAHEAVYTKIKNNRLVLKNSLKNFFHGLRNKTHKVSLKNSFVEYVYLKTMFVDKVYLMSMIDLHDYATKVLTAGTRMAKDTISRMT